MIRSGFFNSMNGDRKYDASKFAEYFASFIGNGVFPDSLQVVSNNNMTVTVKAGKAWINGYIMINDADYILNINAADGVLNRIDRIVLRYDVVDREIRLEVKQGTFAASPIAPAIQRDTDAYELCIANITVSAGSVSITQDKITDTRLDADLCGKVDTLIAGDFLSLSEDVNNLQDNKFDKNGDGKDITVTFTEAGADADIASGDKLSTLFGKLLKNLNTLRNSMYNIVNGGTTVGKAVTLNGLLSSIAELNFVKGVTSAIQTQLNGKAPTSHASTGTSHGIGTAANYGHVKTIDALTQASHIDGTALSAYQGYLLASIRTALVTASGNWTVPAGVYKVNLVLIGGGGGGGGGTTNGGGGGGGSGYIKYFFDVPVTPGEAVPIVIGAGGTGGAGTTGYEGLIGNAGGYTQFRNVNYKADGSTATGSSTGTALGGTGADKGGQSGNSGTVHVGGTGGCFAYINNTLYGGGGGGGAYSGNGATGGLPYGGKGGNANSVGSNATGYGAGGGGGGLKSAGGNGSAGICIITY